MKFEPKAFFDFCETMVTDGGMDRKWFPDFIRLVGDFDFSVDEQCAQYDECDQLTPFVTAGKAVFEAEYELAPDRFCPQARRLRLSAIRKRPALDAWRQTCS